MFILTMFGFWKIEGKIREKENKGKVKEKKKNEKKNFKSLIHFNILIQTCFIPFLLLCKYKIILKCLNF